MEKQKITFYVVINSTAIYYTNYERPIVNYVCVYSTI